MNITSRIWTRLLRYWWQFTIPLRLRAIGVSIGKDVCFYGMPVVSMSKKSKIIIGDRVTLCSDSRFTALGVNHPVVLRTLRVGSQIYIGSDTGISGGAICAAINIAIGSECLLGANVTIADNDFHSTNPKNRRFNNDENDIRAASIEIHDNVFIGMNSTILKGVTIGENSVIGAGSIVTKNIIKNSSAAGCPAIHLRA